MEEGTRRFTVIDGGRTISDARLGSEPIMGIACLTIPVCAGSTCRVGPVYVKFVKPKCGVKK